LQPTDDQMKFIEEIYRELNDHIYQALENDPLVTAFSLLIYGSAVNGLAMSEKSDLDLSLVV
jgi:tRNA nucleotidyltransferase (CCA-adding enzyme)